MDVYLVGGAVRDRRLGLPVQERDWVVVGATPAQLLALGYLQVGKDFPVFLHPQTHEEYALARTERKIGPGYTGFVVQAGIEVSLEADLARRDLTINAMAETAQGELIDPYGGEADLQAGILRHVSPAFTEDPVRILRVARFAARFAQFGFRVAHETHRLLKTMVEAGEVDALVPERVWKELSRALEAPNSERFFIVLQRCHALLRLFPALAPLFPDTLPTGHDAALPPALLGLQRAAQAQTKPAIRLAALLCQLAPPAIEQFCQQLRVPAEFKELALLGATHQAAVLGNEPVTADTLLASLERLDAFRRPARFDDFLDLCAVLSNDWAHPRLQQLRTAQARTAGLEAKSLLASGLRGPAVGAALRAQRLAILAALG